MFVFFLKVLYTSPVFQSGHNILLHKHIFSHFSDQKLWPVWFHERKKEFYRSSHTDFLRVTEMYSDMNGNSRLESPLEPALQYAF